VLVAADVALRAARAEGHARLARGHRSHPCRAGDVEARRQARAQLEVLAAGRRRLPRLEAELAVQYKNGSLSTAGQGAIQSEVDALSAEITRIQGAAQFNGIDLLGTAASVSFQVGANDSQEITVSFGAVSISDYSALGSVQLSTIDSDIDAVSAARSGFGAVQNRLEHALAVTGSYQENLTSAESRIRDVDMAEEMVTLTKNQILQQAGTAMLAQANQAPQAVLQLLR